MKAVHIPAMSSPQPCLKPLKVSKISDYSAYTISREAISKIVPCLVCSSDRPPDSLVTGSVQPLNSGHELTSTISTNPENFNDTGIFRHFSQSDA